MEYWKSKQWIFLMLKADGSIDEGKIGKYLRKVISMDSMYRLGSISNPEWFMGHEFYGYIEGQWVKRLAPLRSENCVVE